MQISSERGVADTNQAKMKYTLKYNEVWDVKVLFERKEIIKERSTPLRWTPLEAWVEVGGVIFTGVGVEAGVIHAFPGSASPIIRHG